MRSIIIVGAGALFIGLPACAIGSVEPSEGESVSVAKSAVSQAGVTEQAQETANRPYSSVIKAGDPLKSASMNPVSLNVTASGCWDLAQGAKDNDVGDVCVSNDNENIYVAYSTDGGCLLTQVHVCAATADYPWTPPGQCPYKAELNGSPTDAYTVTIPLSSFPDAVCDATVFYIQAHAALDCTAAGGGQESAYGNTFKGKIQYTLQCVDEGGGCTLTQGYWKNHAEDWASVDVVLGGATYSHAEALALLQTPTGGDASLILSHQLIAAKLNLLVGGASDAAIASAVAGADAWLAVNADADGALPFGVAAASAAGGEAVALATALDDYNNGITGPGHCE